MAGTVVVGMGGSRAADLALEWARREARLRQAELVACLVLADLDDFVESPGIASLSKQQGDRSPSPVVIRRVVGDVTEQLVRAADGADLLVLGGEEGNLLPGLVQRSVTRTCVARARCPVVVVRSWAEDGTLHGRVAVGVDGSIPGRQALVTAAQEARRRGAALDVIHVVSWDKIGTEMLTPSTEQLIAWGHALIDAELAGTGAAGRATVVHGRPGETLVRLSAHADLLVVGTHGRGAVASLLVGSVTEQCVGHAACPVLVTRGAFDAHAESASDADVEGGRHGATDVS